MFRHERPQKGRLRQFHQMGIEAIGQKSASIDVEVITVLMTICRMFDLPNPVLELNSLGDPSSRNAYRQVIQDFFRDHMNLLSDNEKVRLEENPMRLLDSKNPKLTPHLSQAPKILDYLNDASKTYFDEVLAGLDACKIAYTINPSIVRGLDYYGDTAFEVKVDGLGAQSTVGAGGRYDHLGQQLQGKDHPGVGFGLGLERLLLSMPSLQLNEPDTYAFVPLDKACTRACMALAAKLRTKLPHAVVHVLHDVPSLKSGLRQANKYNATHALIMGPDEFQASQIAWKNFDNQTQQTHGWEEFLTKVSP
jgi:histidyl-tRNA synthetase